MGKGTPPEVEESKGGATPYEDRLTLGEAVRKMMKNSKLEDYQKTNNSMSLDGLPGLKCARKAEGHSLWMDLLETRAKRVIAQKDALFTGVLFAVLIMVLMRMAGLRV